MEKLLKVFICLIVLSILISCDSDKYSYITFENGILKIDKKGLENSGLELHDIQIVDDSIAEQGVSLDSTLRINNVYTLKNKLVNKNGKNWNNWLSINYDGNLNLEDSYFYEETLFIVNDTLYAEIQFLTSKFKNGQSYILYGNVKDDFSFVHDIDTVYFKNNIAIFPLNNVVKGRNDVRFLIVDETKSNKKTKKKRSIMYGTLRFDYDGR